MPFGTVYLLNESVTEVRLWLFFKPGFTPAIVIGSITSAAWGYLTEKNLAMAYIAPEYTVIEVDVVVGVNPDDVQ